MGGRTPLDIIFWIITLLLQAVAGLVVGFIFSVILRQVWVISILFSWIGITVGIFLVGISALLLRRSISPKTYLARFGFTALGVLVPLIILIGLGLKLGVDSEAIQDRWGIFLVLFSLVIGLLGFYMPGLIHLKAKTTQKQL